LALDQEKYWKEFGIINFMESIKNGKSIRLTFNDTSINQSESIPLNQAIVESISQINNKENRKKMYSNLILTGGSSLIPSLKEEIEDRLLELVPNEVENINIITIPGINPIHYVFKGATTLGKLLEKTYWISSQEWNLKGPSILRKKLTFNYDNQNNKKVKTKK